MSSESPGDDCRAAANFILDCCGQRGRPVTHGAATCARPSIRGEAPEGRGNTRDHIVRLGDVSPAGLREKARFVLGEMERRMGALGFGWRDTAATQLYTVHDIHPLLADELVRRGAARSGVTWHYNRPPVVDLEYEMDCHGVAIERVV